MPEVNGSNEATLTSTFNAAAAPPTQGHVDGDVQTPAQNADPTSALEPGYTPEAPQGAPQQTQSADADRTADEALRAKLEDERASLDREIHYRPDDQQLVQDVHTDIEADRELTIKQLTPEPALPEPDAELEKDYHVDPDFDDGFDFTM